MYTYSSRSNQFTQLLTHHTKVKKIYTLAKTLHPKEFKQRSRSGRSRCLGASTALQDTPCSERHPQKKSYRRGTSPQRTHRTGSRNQPGILCTKPPNWERKCPQDKPDKYSSLRKNRYHRDTQHTAHWAGRGARCKSPLNRNSLWKEAARLWRLQ